MRTILSRIIFVICLFLFASSPVSRAQKPSKGLAEVGNGRLAYEIMGHGPTVVLIHGGLVDSRLWDLQFAQFAKRHRVLRYDLRGFGKSDFPTRRFSHVADLYSLLKFLKIEHASLAGLSLGGTIAADFALEHAEMVDALVLVSSGLRGYEGARNEQAIAIYKVAETEGKDRAIDLWLAHPFFASGRNNSLYQKSMRTMLNDNFRYWGPTPVPIELEWPSPTTIKRLDEITKPTLIIFGDRDAANIQTIAGVLKDKIHTARKVSMSGVSHHLNMEKPKEFNRLVLDFLKANVR